MLRLSTKTLYKIKNNAFGRNKQEYDIYYGDVLGTGGFSTVYQAKCRRSGEAVAVKEMKKDIIIKEGLLERVTQEINIQAELDHPAVLKLYTAFEDADHIYIVLELCSKGELRKYVPVFSEKEVGKFMKQIVDGLIYLHGKNILHRDIKLSNVLLTEDMKIKIADFGLATKLSHPDERHMTMCGTPNYISPEVVTRKTHGFEVDLWSLGILLYTLLVGRPPFETDTVKSTLNKVVAGDYYMPLNLSQPAKNLISCLLQKNPYNRMNLYEVLQHPFLSEDDSLTRQKWISSDSGFDPGIISSSNSTSSKFHSLDRKQYSHNSDGYYSYDTPKIPRRCRSQERKIPESRDEMIDVCIDKMTNVDKCLYQNYNHDYLYSNEDISKKQTDSINNYKNDYHSDFVTSNGKPNCQMFCENEILNRQNCDCLECKYKIGRTRDNSKYSNSCQYSSKSNCHSDKPHSDYSFKPSTSDIRNDNNHKKTSSSESVFAVETFKVTPFNTERLKPARESNKHVILSLLKNGEVCVEFFSKNSKKRVITEVCRITKNGLKMSVYYPNGGRGVPPSDTPPPMPITGPNAVFHCETLTKENFRKYAYAARFVEFLQTKTAKITLYTEKARCCLMENKPDPNFEISYYDGVRITKSRNGIKFTDNNGVICLLDDTGQENIMNSRQNEYYSYFKQCYNHCRLIEEKLSSTCSVVDPFFKVFPAILGKRPTFKGKDSTWDGCTESPNLFHSTKYAE